MSASKDTGIELHFCRDCGISIPIADIESGRANPSLPGCSYGFDRCTNRAETAGTGSRAGAGSIGRSSTGSTPSAGASGARSLGAGSWSAGSSGDGGMRMVAAIALLYVVGVSTFLLFREIRRVPPQVNLPTDVAMVRDIHGLERAIESLRDQTDTALTQLKSNDSMQASILTSQRTRLQELADVFTRDSEASKARDVALSHGLLKLTDETMGLKTPLGDILKRLDRMGSGAGNKTSGESDAGNGTKDSGAGDSRAGDSGTNNSGPDAGAMNGTDDDPKLRAQAADFIQQLMDRKSSDQTRYNAAVQLGDLGHASAVDPLLRALSKDSYDLVRRAAAFSLGNLGRHSVRAVPALIEGVSKQESYVGYMCARALIDIAKSTLNQTVEFGYDPTMTARQRRGVSKKWQGWWDKNKARVE